MPDFLDILAKDAKATIDQGYYVHPPRTATVPGSLKNALTHSKAVPVITEIKGASPSAGAIRKDFAPEKIAEDMARGGAAGISVLTEPKHFDGALGYLARVRQAVKLPILMKDIILSETQLEAGARFGANAALLIQALFDRGYSERSVDEMVAEAHSRNLEVLLETRSADEFQRALKSGADMVGINNRDLRTLQVDLKATKRILENNTHEGKTIVSESGIATADDVRFLRACGANAFLVGSAIMRAHDVEAKVRELVHAF